MTDSNNYYGAQINSAGTVSLEKKVAGAFTSLGTFSLGSPSATLKLVITDGSKQVYVNGTLRISSADNALTSAGAVGMRLFANYGTVTTKPNVDNLIAVYVQNVSAPPAPPVSPPSPPDPISYDSGKEPPRPH